MLTKVLRKLTYESIRKNKKRSVATVIGILLSCALICAVAGSVSSARETLIRMEKEQAGDFHAILYNVPEEALPLLTEDSAVDRAEVVSLYGYAILPGGINEDKPYVHVIGMTPEVFEIYPFTLTEGRAPETDAEIVISNHVRTNGGVTYSVGDTVTFDIGERITADGTWVLSQQNPFMGKEEETLTGTVPRTFTVVGLMSRPNMSFESYSAPGYTVVCGPSTGSAGQLYYVSLTFKDLRKATAHAERLHREVSGRFGENIGMSVNTSLISYEGGMREATMTVLRLLATVIIAIILGTSVIVIRNSFRISVAEKTRQYGILKSVGATSKQIEKSVLYEGFLLGSIGIPLGIVLGVIAVRVLMYLTNLLIGEGNYLDIPFVFYISPVVIAVTILVSALTIFLSCLIPSRRAGRTPAIEAIRGNREVKLTGKSLKSPRIVKKLFGVSGVIAMKSLRRSRSKYRTTVLSLVVSVTVFVAMSWFTDTLKQSAMTVYTNHDYNMLIQSEDASVYDEIASRYGWDPADYCYAYGVHAVWDTERYGSEYTKSVWQEGTIEGRIFLISRDYFEVFARQQGVTEDVSRAAFLFDQSLTIDEESGKRETHHYFAPVKQGDVITYSIPRYYEQNENGAPEWRDYTEVDVTITQYRRDPENMPAGFQGAWIEGGALFVSEDYFDDRKIVESASLYSMTVNVSDPEEVETELTALMGTDEKYRGIYVMNLAKQMEQQRRMLIVINIFLYGFIIVITLIGVTNVFNTITTNMILRAREFAMLKSVGMTNGQFHRMILLESVFYGLRALLIGLPAGGLLSYLLYYIFREQVDLGYRIPFAAMGISTVAVFLIVILTMWYSIGKINAQNMIDVIRTEVV